MKRLLSLCLALILAACIGGCAKPPTPEEVERAEYGPRPDEYQEIVKGKFNTMLKDPYSAVYQFHGRPVKGYIIKNGKADFGWVGNVSVNAKNSFGAYAGAKMYQYLIWGGIVTDLRLK